jgi:DNA-binding MltR family transcriptional regulator
MTKNADGIKMNDRSTPMIPSFREELLQKFPNLKDFVPYLEELNKESPRGKVLVSTGYLEQMLEEILRAFMLGVKTVDDLFEGGNAPLGTFSSRAKMCHALGLISDDEFHDIDQIRRIRNHFAHKMSASFREPTIKDRCNLLRHSAGHYAELKMDNPEGQFASAAAGMLLNMVNRAAYVADKRLKFED